MTVRLSGMNAMRRLRRPWLVVPAALLVGLGGCKHRRSAMRPVLLGPPAEVVVPAAEPPCGPGYAEPCDPVEVAPPAGFSEPDGLSPAAPATSEPTLDRSVVPQRLNEPPLSTDDYEPTSTPPPASRVVPLDEDPLDIPPLTAPMETRRRAPGRSAAATTKQGTRTASLRSRVQPFVNDPADLFEPPRADRQWRYVVLHHSAHAEGSYGQIDRDHKERLGTMGCGYHFVIGNGSESPDGMIEVARRWSEQRGGAHCRDAKSSAVNDYGIGICLVGDLDQDGPTPKQVEAMQALVAYLSDRYHIRADNVGTHAQIAQNPTACPGKHFPVTAIRPGRSMAAR